jgi:hypothetical protein
VRKDQNKKRLEDPNEVGEAKALLAKQQREIGDFPAADFLWRFDISHFES